MTVIDTGIYRSSLNCDIEYRSLIKVSKLLKRTKRGNGSGSLMATESKIRKIAAAIYLQVCRRCSFKYLYDHAILPHKYDVEIAFLEGLCAKILSNRNRGIPSKKIAWIHTELDKNRKSEGFFLNHDEERSVYCNFDEIVCVSNTVQDAFLRKFHLENSEASMHVIHNSIDVEEIIEKSEEKVFDLKKRRFTLCSIGRLDAVKGYDRLINICGKLKEERVAFDCWIIGDGPDKESLRKQIEDKNLSTSVQLLGYKENPFPYLKSADLFVCSSRAEGYSTVITEASILEVPVISTDCSGVREQLGDSTIGLVVENDEAALYHGIKRLLLDNELLKRYQEAAQSRSAKLKGSRNDCIEFENLISN